MSPKMQTGILLLLLHASFLVTPSSSAAPELANAAGTANTTANRTQLSSWAGNIVNTVNNILESARNQTAGANSSASLSAISDMMSRVPGILKGLEGVDFGGNDVGRTLASLFGDPRAAGVPEWVEAMLQGNNSSQALSNLGNISSVFSGKGIDENLQTTLNEIFKDVLKGLNSLDLDTNSTAKDVVSAIRADPGLQASQSTGARQMLEELARQLGLTEQLQDQFPLVTGSQCAADLQAFGTAIQQQQIWALQMLDAMGKLQAGFFTGQGTLFGDYDQCMAISHPQGSHTIEGQLCGMALKAPDVLAGFLTTLGRSPVIGLHVCLPKSCNEGHIKYLLTPTVTSLGSQIYGIGCPRPKNPEGDNRFLGVMITMGILALLCAAGTLYGVLLDANKEKKPDSVPQDKLPTKIMGHVNGGFTNEKTAGMPEGGPVNGGFTNEKTAGMPEGHVNGGLAYGPPNGDCKIAAFSKDVDAVNLTAVVTMNGDGGMVNGQNGEAGGKIAKGTAVTADIPSGTHLASAGESLPSKLLLSFSVLRNGRKLLATTKNHADISCLHGIRVLSITWVILGHAFSQLNNVQGNQSAIVDFFSHWTYMVVPGALMAVDTFFLLSGCLTAYLFLRSTKKTGITVSGMVIYYIHRIWRLTPLYGLLVAFYVGVFPYLKKGPYQDLVGMDSVSSCRDYWYLNILYVNNVVDDSLSKLCFGWSWYLSNDMQFYVIAPIVLIPWALRGRAKICGFILAVGLILTHVITTAVFVYRDNLTLFTNGGKYMSDVYIVPWCRVGPYAVGLILGYILFATRCRYNMTKLAAVMGWTMAWAVGLVLVYIHYDNLGDIMHGLGWNASDNAAYESLNKVMWAVCVSWVIFACSTGFGGFVNTLLSWGAWAPLSRLSYGVYLVHLVVLHTLTGNLKRPFYLDGWTATQLNLSVTVLSFLAAFVFSMLIEAPTLGLEKAILGKILRKKH